MNRKWLMVGVMAVAEAVLSACAGTGGYIAVRSAPPPPRAYGIVGVAPGPNYVWVDGFWDWQGGGWRWRQGYWARPPRRGAIWVSPRWEHSGRAYRYHRGYWR